MDFGKVLGRAWEITWRWKILWVLGFLASLGQGSSASTSSYSVSGDEFDLGSWPLFRTYEELAAGILGLIILICCVLIVIAIVIWVVSVIARGGLIAGVQQVEEEGSTTFRRAWAAGVKKFWTLFGLSILAALPMILLVIVGVIFLSLGIGVGIGMLDQAEAAGITTIVFVSIICGGLLCCGLIALRIVLEQIRIYAERAAILEDLGWIDAFKRGWQVLKENLGATIILWLIFLALGIVIFIISIPIMFLLSLPFLALIPLADSGAWMVVPAICGGLLFFIIIAVIRTLVTVFSSATWTLAYRELTGLQAPPSPDVEQLDEGGELAAEAG